jgi:hypothetical protein
MNTIRLIFLVFHLNTENDRFFACLFFSVLSFVHSSFFLNMRLCKNF